MINNRKYRNIIINQIPKNANNKTSHQILKAEIHVLYFENLFYHFDNILILQNENKSMSPNLTFRIRMRSHRLILHWYEHTICLISFSSLTLINLCAIIFIIRIKSVLKINIHEYLIEHKLR